MTLLCVVSIIEPVLILISSIFSFHVIREKKVKRACVCAGSNPRQSREDIDIFGPSSRIEDGAGQLSFLVLS